MTDLTKLGIRGSVFLLFHRGLEETRDIGGGDRVVTSFMPTMPLRTLPNERQRTNERAADL